MKLFGGTKRKKAVRGENVSVSDETRPIHISKNKIKAASDCRTGEKKRAVKIILWSVALLAVLALVLFLSLRIVGNSPKAEPDASISDENKEEPDEPAAEKENSVIILPLSPEAPAETAVPDESEEPVAEEPQENVRNNNCYTFLLACYGAKGISIDTIMVSRLDVAEGSLNVVSIPRDTLVNVSWAIKKINTVAAYEEGDTQEFIDEVGSILGFSPDYYAFINADTVEKMVDAIGGVYYTVPRNMDYDDEVQDLHIHVPTGYQWLDGDKAVQVLRFRVGNNGTGYPNGDIGRIETLQDFLMNLFSQFLEKGEIPNLEELADIFDEYSTGNLDADKLLVFADEFMKLDVQNIRFASLPGRNVGIGNISYYEISPVEWVETVNEYLNPYSQDVALHELDILMCDASNGSVMSTSGEIIDLDSFY